MANKNDTKKKQGFVLSFLNEISIGGHVFTFDLLNQTSNYAHKDISPLSLEQRIFTAKYVSIFMF